MIKDPDYYEKKLAALIRQKKECENKMIGNPCSFDGRTEEGDLIPKVGSEAGFKMANELIILKSEIVSTERTLIRLGPK